MNNELFIKDTIKGYQAIRSILTYGEVEDALRKIEEYLESIKALGIEIGEEHEPRV